MRSSMDALVTKLMTLTPLADPVNAADALLQDGRVPGDIHVDYHRAALEVQTHTPGIGGEEDLAGGIFPKPRHQLFALFGGDHAVEMDVGNAVSCRTRSTSSVMRSHWLKITTFSPPLENHFPEDNSNSSIFGP